VTRDCSTAICVAKINLSLQTAAGSLQNQINSFRAALDITALIAVLTLRRLTAFTTARALPDKLQGEN
jgi:hypothetical protein